MKNVLWMWQVKWKSLWWVVKNKTVATLSLRHVGLIGSCKTNEAGECHTSDPLTSSSCLYYRSLSPYFLPCFIAPWLESWVCLQLVKVPWSELPVGHLQFTSAAQVFTLFPTDFTCQHAVSSQKRTALPRGHRACSRQSLHVPRHAGVLLPLLVGSHIFALLFFCFSPFESGHFIIVLIYRK